jgi:hypothetical protein
MYAEGMRDEEILESYPDLEQEDLREALQYTAISIDEVITEAFHLLEQESQKQPFDCVDEQLSWEETYQEMAKEKEDWSE